MVAKQRVVKTEVKLTPHARSIAFQMMRASADISNLLIDQFKYKRKALKAFRDADPNADKPWEINSYLSYFGWADETVTAFWQQQSCPWPQQTEQYKTRGKSAGQIKERIALEKNNPASLRGIYGVPGQCKKAICREFEASIEATLTKRRQGDSTANYPSRYKGLRSVTFPSQLVKRKGNQLTLGAQPFVIRIKVPQLKGFDLKGDVKLTRSRSGCFYLSIGVAAIQEKQDFQNVAAIDLGQKRAMMISVLQPDGTVKSASISGKKICAIKQTRDLAYRRLQRKRSRLFKGQLRQYLTPEQKETYRRLQVEDNQRQAEGKTRTGDDVKYAYRCISAARQALRLRKYSKQDWKLKQSVKKVGDKAEKRLRYANHCITRAAADWLIENEVGKVFVGDLHLPKRRKKGNRRIKQVHRNSLWEYPTQVKYLGQKLELVGSVVEEHHERNTSRTCPSCGRLHKPRNRVYHCFGCGWTGDRDEVGSTNFLSLAVLGECGKLMPSQNIQNLRISSAFRQGRLCRSLAGKPACKLTEDSPKSATGSTVQALLSGEGLPLARSGRNAQPAGTDVSKGQSRGACKDASPSPIVVSKPDRDSATANPEVFSKKLKRSLNNQTESHVQLTLWDTA